MHMDLKMLGKYYDKTGTLSRLISRMRGAKYWHSFECNGRQLSRSQY